jgi:signal peptidase I
MKKVTFISVLSLGALLGLLFVLVILSRIAGYWGSYQIATTGSDPTLKVGQVVFGESYSKPELYDFVAFEVEDPLFRDQIWIQRVCGNSSDTVQIIAGVLFVNGINFDDSLTLNHSYCLGTIEAHRLIQEKICLEEEVFFFNPDSAIVHLTKKEKNLLGEGGEIQKSFIPRSLAIYGQQWTVDDFGPIVVPDNSLFLMGDSRDNSMDSRFMGCVSKEAVVSVIWDK